MATRAVALSGALVIGLGAAACSTSDDPASTSTTTSTTPAATSSTTDVDAPDASDILERAKDNALSATSGAFAGQIEQDGRTIKIDFKGTSDGKTADISIDSEGDGKARLIALPEAIYIQGDQAFWKKQDAPAAVQKAGDKFIKAPSSAGSMAESLSLKNFLQKAFDAVKVEKMSTDVGSRTVNGIDCWVLTDEKGSEAGALYVSKDKGELVRFTGSTESPGQLEFSRWNEDLGIKAPAASRIMPLG